MYNFITDENAKLREKLIKFFMAHKNGYFDMVYLSSYFSIPKDKLRINLNKLVKKEILEKHYFFNHEIYTYGGE